MKNVNHNSRKFCRTIVENALRLHQNNYYILLFLKKANTKYSRKSVLYFIDFRIKRSIFYRFLLFGIKRNNGGNCFFFLYIICTPTASKVSFYILYVFCRLYSIHIDSRGLKISISFILYMYGFCSLYERSLQSRRIYQFILRTNSLPLKSISPSRFIL